MSRDILRLGSLRSLGFGLGNPHEFIAKHTARAHIQGKKTWSFLLTDASAPIHVITDQEVAKWCLSNPGLFAFYRGDLLEKFFGRGTLILEGKEHSDSRRALMEKILLGESIDPSPYILGQLTKITWESGPKDLVELLQKAAIAWGLRILGRHSASGVVDWHPELGKIPASEQNAKSEDLIWEWLEASKSRTLLVPRLRTIPLLGRPTKGWRGILEMDESMTREGFGPLERTFLAGLVDNAVLTAAECFASYGRWEDIKSGFYPVPMLFREATEYTLVKGIGIIRKGHGIGISTRITGLGFGSGTHACPGKKLADLFIEEVRRTKIALGLRTVPGQEIKRDHIRLSYGIKKLMVYRKPNAAELARSRLKK